MSMTYIDWIEKYNMNFQLFVNETTENPIYKKVDFKERIGDLAELNKGIVDVTATRIINDKVFYKIKYENKTIGWCNTDNSIKFLRTKQTEVKISNADIPEEINTIIGIDTQKLKENIIKIFRSDFYAVYRGEIYVAIFLKDELLGFINIEDISFFKEMRKDFKFKSMSVNLYKDSKLQKVIIENFEHMNHHYTLLGSFESFNAARVMIDGKRYWIDKNIIDLDIKVNKITDTNEIIIDALLFQMNDKLEKQIEHSNKEIEAMNSKIKEYEKNEKTFKDQMSVIKGLL